MADLRIVPCKSEVRSLKDRSIPSKCSHENTKIHEEREKGFGPAHLPYRFIARGSSTLGRNGFSRTWSYTSAAAHAPAIGATQYIQ